MALVWSKLKPQDKYRVFVEKELSLFEIKTVGQLYQPLMGSSSFSLYMTLLSEAESDRRLSVIQNHQWLINLMNIPLDQIYQARLRLEALGLLNVYLTMLDDEEIIEYTLLPPLGVEQFFAEDILSISLYNKVGTHRYRKLRARYLVEKEEQSAQNKKEITHEFHEVFTSIHPSELILKEGSEQEKEMRAISEAFPVSTSHEKGTKLELSFERYPLDIEALKGFFMKGISAEALLTPKNLREIKKVAFFYQLDLWSLSRIIQDALTLEDELDLTLFRERAKEWYRLQQGGQPPQIIQMTQPVAKRIFHAKEPLNEEEKHLAKLEEISPLQLLEAYQGGGKVAEADLKLVEELIFDYELYPAVVNLLLEYILLTNDYKLPRNLVTKVAAHWKRLQITDIREAQALARKEHGRYKEWQEKKQSGQVVPANNVKKASPAKGGRKEILPEWIIDPTKEDSSYRKVHTSLTEEEKRERAEQLLKSIGEWGKDGGE